MKLNLWNNNYHSYLLRTEIQRMYFQKYSLMININWKNTTNENKCKYCIFSKRVDRKIIRFVAITIILITRISTENKYKKNVKNIMVTLINWEEEKNRERRIKKKWRDRKSYANVVRTHCFLITGRAWEITRCS